MERKEFIDQIKSGNISGVYLFEGEEEHLKQSALLSLRKTILPEGLEELNETVMEAPETDALIAAAETVPFMADKRLVIVRDHPALTGKADSSDVLADYLNHVPETCVLIFYCQAKPDGRKKLYSAIKKTGNIVTFSPLKDLELTSWVTRAFQDRGNSCDDRIADQLVFTCGTDTGLLLNEIEKISAYAGPGAVIMPEQVRMLATPSTECTVFEMVDAVVSGQHARALTLMSNLLTNGSERLPVLALLLRQYRMLQHVKIMQFEKKSEDFIRQKLGVPPFAVKQYIRQASLYSGKEIKQAVALCLDMEYAIKSGRINQAGSLEAVILKLLTLHEA